MAKAKKKVNKKKAPVKKAIVKAEEIIAKKEECKAPVAIDMNKANINLLKWPSDRWGCCRVFKRAILAAASRCAGHPEKMKILGATLQEGINHINAKDLLVTEQKKTAALKLAKENAKNAAEAS